MTILEFDLKFDWVYGKHPILVTEYEYIRVSTPTGQALIDAISYAVIEYRNVNSNYQKFIDGSVSVESVNCFDESITDIANPARGTYTGVEIVTNAGVYSFCHVGSISQEGVRSEMDKYLKRYKQHLGIHTRTIPSDDPLYYVSQIRNKVWDISHREDRGKVRRVIREAMGENQPKWTIYRHLMSSFGRGGYVAKPTGTDAPDLHTHWGEASSLEEAEQKIKAAPLNW